MVNYISAEQAAKNAAVELQRMGLPVRFTEYKKKGDRVHGRGGRRGRGKSSGRGAG